MMHYDDEALFQYVEGTSPIASEIESHVSSCERCAAEVGENREMIAVLASGDVWSERTPSSRHFSVDVGAFAERARREEEKAIALCDEILTGPPAWWGQRLRKTEGAHTGGMVKQLLERMRGMLETNPVSALQVTSLAVEIANSLDVIEYASDYVIKLRAQAFRDHAYVLSFMGRYPEALGFADRAERLFDQVPLPEYDLARLALVKAFILRSLDRGAEAVALTHDAAEAFLRFGDRSRYVTARMTEGAIIYHSGSVAEALAVWTSLDGDPALDDVAAVRLAHNIAVCHADLGDAATAAERAGFCSAQFETLGLETERTRSRWLLARSLIASGRTREAIPVLRKTRAEFDDLDLIADSGLVALELAESLLVLGQPEEVPAICREVITQFTRAGMASRAMTALSFLREAVAIGQATPSLVQHVHAFLRELPAEQPRLFAPQPVGLGD